MVGGYICKTKRGCLKGYYKVLRTASVVNTGTRDNTEPIFLTSTTIFCVNLFFVCKRLFILNLTKNFKISYLNSVFPTQFLINTYIPYLVNNILIKVVFSATQVRSPCIHIKVVVLLRCGWMRELTVEEKMWSRMWKYIRIFCVPLLPGISDIASWSYKMPRCFLFWWNF